MVRIAGLNGRQLFHLPPPSLGVGLLILFVPWVIAWYPRGPTVLYSPSFPFSMAPHGFQYGPLGALRTGSGSPDFPTALDVMHADEEAHAPMPSFPPGSPVFPSPSLVHDDDHVLISGSQLAAIWTAVPSPSPTPSHYSASPTTFAAIQQALPDAPMDTVPSPPHTSGSRTPRSTVSILPSLLIPWSPTQVQTAPVHNPPSHEPTDEVSYPASGPPVDYSAVLRFTLR